MTEVLAAAEERWRLTVDAAPVGIALVSPQGVVMDANEACAAILDSPREELIGSRTRDVFLPDSLDEYRALTRDLLDGRVPRFQLRKWFRRPDGRKIWLDVYAALARTPMGAPAHFVVYLDDVTDHVETTERLDRINQDLIRQSDRLARSNDDLEAFATVASHDLQAPLATIRGYLELLQGEYAEELGQNGRLWVGRAAGAASRMSELLTSLLEFSRAAGGGEPRRRPVAVDAILQRVLADLDGTFSTAEVKLHLVDAHTQVVADPTRLHQVLQNLVENAVKYRHPLRPPEISVRVVEGRLAWRVDVIDNGIGVPETDRESVFAMFHQAGSDDEGFGIGLAVSRRIVERHGGSIWVEPVPGGGSCFSFTLPRS